MVNAFKITGTEQSRDENGNETIFYVVEARLENGQVIPLPKRYSEFRALHEELKKDEVICSGQTNNVAKAIKEFRFPGKFYFGDPKDEAKKRMAAFNLYIQLLDQLEELPSSARSFLGLDDIQSSSILEEEESTHGPNQKGKSSSGTSQNGKESTLKVLTEKRLRRPVGEAEPCLSPDAPLLEPPLGPRKGTLSAAVETIPEDKVPAEEVEEVQIVEEAEKPVFAKAAAVGTLVAEAGARQGESEEEGTPIQPSVTTEQLSGRGREMEKQEVDTAVLGVQLANKVAAKEPGENHLWEDLTASRVVTERLCPELDTLRADKGCLVAEFEASRANREEPSAELEAVKTDRERLRSELEASRAEREQISAEFQASRVSREKLREELEATKVDAERLSSELAASRADKEKIGAHLEASIIVRGKLSAELELEKGDAQRLNTELEALRADRERLGAELEASKADRERLGAALASSKSSRERLGAELAAARAEGRRRGKELREALDAAARPGAEAEALRMESEGNDQSDKLQILEVEMDKVKAELHDQMLKHEKLKEELNQEIADKQALEDQLHKMEEQLERMDDEYYTNNAAQQELEGRLALLAQENEDLARALKDLHDSAQIEVGLAEEAAERAKEGERHQQGLAEALSTQLEALRPVLADHEDEIMKKSEEILKLKEHQRQLKAREIDLRQTHETSMLESTVLKLQTEMEQCQSELEQARGKLIEVQREKEKEMRSLQLQNEQGTKKHRSMITDYEKLKGSLALKEEEVNKLSKELHKQSSQSDDLRLASASKEKEIARLRVSHTEELKKIRDLHKRMMAESKRKNKMDAEKAAEKIIKLEKQLLGCIKSSHLGDCTNEHLGLKGKQEIEQRIEGPRQRKKEKDAVLIDDKDGSQVKIRNSSQHPVDKELLSTSHLTGSLEKKHHKVIGSSSRQHPSRRKLDQRKFSIFFLLWYTFLGGCGSGQQSPHMDQQESITVIMMALTWSCIHLL